MEGLMKLFEGILGSFGKDGAMSGIMDTLGSKGMANLIQGGSALYGGMKAGDMMDFNQTMATKAAGHQDTLMANSQEDREKLAKLDFSPTVKTA